MGIPKTFQTVKLPLDVWQIVDRTMQETDRDFSNALELLIRHGHVRLQQLQEKEREEVLA